MERAHGKVLLVEDFPGLSSVTAKLLGRAGYGVILAESGEAALEEIARHGVPDLLIADISLPGMSGLDLVREVRRTAPHVKVLLTSGSMEHGPAIATLGGATLFLPKPYHGEDLMGRIRDLAEMPPRRRKSDREERKPGEAS